MNQELALVFDEKDLIEAKALFINQLGANKISIDSPDNMLNDGLVDTTFWIDMAKITIPALAAIIVFWLGKGKQLKIEITKKGKKKSMEIKHTSEKTIIKLLRKFLND